MDEKDITAEMAHEAIARQSNEDEVASVFRLHIMRFWSHERKLNFCLHLLGIDLQEFQAWRGAVEQPVAVDEARPRCKVCGTREHHTDANGLIVPNPPRHETEPLGVSFPTKESNGIRFSL